MQARYWWESATLASKWRGYYYLFAMVGANLLRTVLRVHGSNVSSYINFSLQSGVVSEIYGKALREKDHSEYSTGKLANLASADASGVSGVLDALYTLPGSIATVVIGTAQLMRLLGPKPLVGGLGVLSLFFPLSYLGEARRGRCCHSAPAHSVLFGELL